MRKNQFWERLEGEHPRLLAYCRRLAGNREDGDDIYQDALVAGLTHCGRLRDPDAFRTWIYRIAINTYKNRQRRSWWRRSAPPRRERNDVAGTDRERSETARRWLGYGFAALRPGERALVTLFELEGWSLGELATLLARREGTLKARLSRARRKMRRAIERRLGDSSPAAPRQQKERTVYALFRTGSSGDG